MEEVKLVEESRSKVAPNREARSLAATESWHAK
jgi:hypothetical protein